MANLVLLIERIGDELEVTVDSDSGGTTDNQRARRGAPVTSTGGASHGRNREMKEQKRARKHHEAGGHDHDLSSGVHQTLILIDSPGSPDTVEFRCDKLFTVDVEFDPAYLHPGDPDPKRSPFNWDTPKTGVQATTGGLFIVSAAPFNDAGLPGVAHSRPSDYHFYKMTIWSEGLKMDPDWYCDR